MSEKKVAKPTGGHTSVTNQSEEPVGTKKVGTRVVKAVYQEPSEDKTGNTNKVNSDGTEAVPGHKKTLGAMESIFTAPDTSALKDIGEASFGKDPEVTVRSIIETDDRVQVPNPTNYPWSAISSLLITAANGQQYVGTGWFIGPHTLVTAGHCVWIRETGWVKSITVMPGRNGNSLPFGAVTTSNFRAVTGWTRDGDANFDYGAIILPTNLGDKTGWYGFGVYPDSELLKSEANVSGYPADKPGASTQWYDHHQIANVDNHKVYYSLDTYGGQSGSPVYRIINQSRYGIAIHAYGVSPGQTTNSGTRIDSAVYNNLVAWKS